MILLVLGAVIVVIAMGGCFLAGVIALAKASDTLKK